MAFPPVSLSQRASRAEHAPECTLHDTYAIERSTGSPAFSPAFSLIKRNPAPRFSWPRGELSPVARLAAQCNAS